MGVKNIGNDLKVKGVWIVWFLKIMVVPEKEKEAESPVRGSFHG